MEIIGLIVVYVLIIVYDIPSILKLKRVLVHLIVYICILLSGFVISLLQIIEKPPISPSVIIENIVKSVFSIFV